MQRIIKNAIQCNLCGDIIESTYRHDFVTCKCGCCSVDGGFDYLRRGFTHSREDFTELSILEDTEKKYLTFVRSCDGNGRMSRLLTTLLLYRSGYHVGKYISLESKIAKNKDLYYDALEASQAGWHENADDPTPFIKYLLSVILAAYRELDERLELIGDKPSALEAVRRAVESRIGKFTKTDIMELCPTLGKTSVESSIKQLVDEGALMKHGKGRATFYTKAGC